MTTTVMAAGVLCWRIVDGEARVLLVHRTQHKDVSIPKGKVDPGELLPTTAVRELREETGVTASLGAPLGTVSYTLPNGRPKEVHYWSAEVTDHALQIARFRPNEEISSLEWLTVDKARRKLDYPHDVAILDTFAARLAAGDARTFALIALRHGKAVTPGSWDGPDADRPLLHRGTQQAEAVVPALRAFAPERILSSTARRCLETVAPLAAAAGLEVKATDRISQDAFEDGRDDVPGVVAKRIRRAVTAVLCSHGPVLPAIVAEVARTTHATDSGELQRAGILGTAEFAVVHLSVEHPRRGIVAVETHGSGV